MIWWDEKLYTDDKVASTSGSIPETGREKGAAWMLLCSAGA